MGSNGSSERKLDTASCWRIADIKCGILGIKVKPFWNFDEKNQANSSKTIISLPYFPSKPILHV